MQSIPQVELKPKANTLLINYAENEMPRFSAWLAARHRSGVPPPHPSPLLVRSAHDVPRVCERLCGSAGASSACNRSADAAAMFDCAAVSRIHAAAPGRGGWRPGGSQFGFWRWSLGPLSSLSSSRGASLNLEGSVMDSESDITSSVAQIIWASLGLCLFNTR